MATNYKLSIKDLSAYNAEIFSAVASMLPFESYPNNNSGHRDRCHSLFTACGFDLLTSSAGNGHIVSSATFSAKNINPQEVEEKANRWFAENTWVKKQGDFSPKGLENLSRHIPLVAYINGRKSIFPGWRYDVVSVLCEQHKIKERCHFDINIENEELVLWDWFNKVRVVLVKKNRRTEEEYLLQKLKEFAGKGKLILTDQFENKLSVAEFLQLV